MDVRSKFPSLTSSVIPTVIYKIERKSDFESVRGSKEGKQASDEGMLSSISPSFSLPCPSTWKALPPPFPFASSLLDCIELLLSLLRTLEKINNETLSLYSHLSTT